MMSPVSFLVGCDYVATPPFISEQTGVAVLVMVNSRATTRLAGTKLYHLLSSAPKSLPTSVTVPGMMNRASLLAGTN